MRKRAELAQARRQIDEMLVKAMANALRNQVLAILGERKSSAVAISKELGIDYSQVKYEMDVLDRARLIKQVGERRRRGATEQFYEATARAYLDPSEWPKVADPVKAGLRASLFQNLLVDAATAICEEVYDSMEGAHMSWSPVIVDQQGWTELTAVLLRTLEEVLRIHDDSAERLVAADEEGISCTVSILGYPSAIKKRKVGLPVDAEELISLIADGQEDEGRGSDMENADPKPDAKRKSKGKAKAPGKRRAQKTRQSPKPKRTKPEK
ncbi:MAG TPA: winged helix-turn-helix domain-containing protein [Solirubrobacterales bacterium]|nr:winged helix-turn-helix domain-containing protein [Solirubrobacterales bacterium]